MNVISQLKRISIDRCIGLCILLGLAFLAWLLTSDVGRIACKTGPSFTNTCVFGSNEYGGRSMMKTANSMPDPNGPAQPLFADVFTAGGADGYPGIRIPAVVVSTAGTILAFAEGRQSLADQAENDIVLKRSTDNGATWHKIQVVAEDGKSNLNNPCAVVERSTGRVFVMFQRYPAALHEHDGGIKTGLDGPAIVRNFLSWSDDDGISWSPMKDVTAMTKRPDRVTIMASGPGIGIQLERGTRKGRLIIPFNEGPFGQWNVDAVYSDDKGATWHVGDPPPGCRVPHDKGEISMVNEVQMAEIDGGGVMLNSRKWGGAAVRKVAVSNDGGQSWSAIREEPALRDNGCMASLFRYSFADPKTHARNILLYSGLDSDQRNHGAVRASFDDGATWPVKRELYAGGFAYSCLARLPDGTVGCLFEADNYKRIVFARFPIEWVVGH